MPSTSNIHESEVVVELTSIESIRIGAELVQKSDVLLRDKLPSALHDDRIISLVRLTQQLLHPGRRSGDELKHDSKLDEKFVSLLLPSRSLAFHLKLGVRESK